MNHKSKLNGAAAPKDPVMRNRVNSATLKALFGGDEFKNKMTFSYLLNKLVSVVKCFNYFFYFFLIIMSHENTLETY